MQDVLIGAASLVGGLVLLFGTFRVATVAYQAMGEGKRPIQFLRVLFGCLVSGALGLLLLALAAGSFFPSIR